MNERIFELAKQAGFLEEDGGNNLHVFDGYEAITCTEELKKFAELIVRECIDILMEPRYIMDKSQKLSRYNEGWVNGRLLGIEHIEKHFGVES
jgi:hypothetical protein